MTKRERELERALLVIEGLTFLNDAVDAPYEQLVGRIYNVAHNATGFCNACKSRRKRWLKELSKTMAELKAASIIDVRKVQARKKNKKLSLANHAGLASVLNTATKKKQKKT